MDSEAEAMDFPGWELLHNSNDENVVDFDSEASPLPLIKPDHFSLNPNSNSSSNSSSSTDHSDLDRNFDDSYVANQLFQSSTSNLHLWNNPSDSDCDTTLIDTTTTTNAAATSTQLSAAAAASFDSKEEEEEEQKHEGEEEEEEEEGEHENRVVWWKVPFEVFKYWVVRVSPVPVWSLSVAAAAAFLGLVILGRRLYKMKRKTQTLKLNVALDDKVDPPNLVLLFSTIVIN